MLDLGQRSGSQPVGHDPFGGHISDIYISDIYITIHKCIEITVMKQQ